VPSRSTIISLSFGARLHPPQARRDGLEPKVLGEVP
jgi:hypothetical protein